MVQESLKKYLQTAVTKTKQCVSYVSYERQKKCVSYVGKAFSSLYHSHFWPRQKKGEEIKFASPEPTVTARLAAEGDRYRSRYIYLNEAFEFYATIDNRVQILQLTIVTCSDPSP